MNLSHSAEFSNQSQTFSNASVILTFLGLPFVSLFSPLFNRKLVMLTNGIMPLQPQDLYMFPI